MEIAEKHRLKMKNVSASIINKRGGCLNITTESKKRNIKLVVKVNFFRIVYPLLLDVLPNHYLEATVQITLGRFERSDCE